MALSPVPIIAVVLMPTTRRDRVNGPLFITGWLAGLAVVGAIVLSAAGPADASSSGSLLTAWERGRALGSPVLGDARRLPRG